MYSPTRTSDHSLRRGKWRTCLGNEPKNPSLHSNRGLQVQSLVSLASRLWGYSLEFLDTGDINGQTGYLSFYLGIQIHYMIKLVVFDWNGTVIADSKACFEADNQALKKMGGKTVSFREYRKTITIPSKDFYLMHGARKDMLHKFGEFFHPFYENRISKCRTRRGARELLKWLKSKNIDSVILSNHTLVGINSQLNRLHLTSYLTKVLANTDPNKSNKTGGKHEMLKNFIKKRYQESEVIIIGDSPEEAEIARRFGLKSILITNGYYQTSRLRDSKPDFLITNLSQVKQIIKKL